MHAIHVDSPLGDDARRNRLYDGDLFVYSPRPSTRALVKFAAGMAEQAFGSRDPETAQYEMPVEAYAALLADLKPRFIHHPESKRLIVEMLIGCDPEKVYFECRACALRPLRDTSQLESLTRSTRTATRGTPHRSAN
jgi:hypothetical protein